jgi:predicted DNA-binding protein (UPF0251 family)
MYFPRVVSGTPSGLTRLSVEEVEALRLVDLLGLSHDEAASRMGVSRKTLWRDLTTARRRLVEALVNGWAIQISGGDYRMRGSEEDER